MGGRPTGVLVTLVADPETRARVGARPRAGSRRGVRGGGGGGARRRPVVGARRGRSWSRSRLSVARGWDPVLRSGARAGDVLARARVARSRADAGLRLLKADAVDRLRVAVERQRRPAPPLAAGPEAAAAGATAMLDISDGLLRDGGRLARASRVVIDLDPRGARGRRGGPGRSGRGGGGAGLRAGRWRGALAARDLPGGARCRTDGGRSGRFGRPGRTSLPASSWAAATSATPGGTTSAEPDHSTGGGRGMPLRRLGRRTAPSKPRSEKVAPGTKKAGPRCRGPASQRW